MDLYYEKTTSDGGAGFRYETKITALFALRLVKYFVDFYLVTDFREAGKFDDIVFTLTEGDGEWKTWFIQLKHRLPSTINKKKITISALRSRGELVLAPYFDSYKSIVKKFTPGGEHPIFGKPFSQVRFAIFTNAILNDDLISRNYATVECPILSTNAGLERNFIFDLAKDKHDIFVKMCKDRFVNDFVSRLFMFTQQASEDTLDSIIRSEIKAIFTDLNTDQLKLATYEWISFIQNRSSTFLVREEAQRVLDKISKAQSGKRNDVSIKYIDSFLKFERDGYAQDAVLHLITDGESTMMCMAALSQMGLTSEPNLLIPLCDLSTENAMLLSSWLKPGEMTLVIDCEGDNLGVKAEMVVQTLRLLIGSSDTGRIMFVSTLKNATATDIAQKLRAKRRKFNCTLKNFTDESKAMIKEKDVDFQGYKTSLMSLMPKNKVLDDVFDMTAIAQLLTGRLVKVGMKPVENIPYYVPRMLTRQTTVSPALFTSNEFEACFALSGVNYDEALRIFNNPFLIAQSTAILRGGDCDAKFIVLEGDPRVEFESLAKKVKVPFHWFDRTKKGHWQWKRSTSNIHDLSNMIIQAENTIPSDNVKVYDEKILVITAEPGMGKSTLLDHIAVETKKNHPYKWIVSLALNDYTEYFDKPDFIQNIEKNTKLLISLAAGFNEETSKFNARLFDYCYDVSGNMAVFLDGFDEITPHYTEQGLAMIKCLKSSRVAPIWVTTRTAHREILEEVACTLSFTIKPFIEKDQRAFLEKYWKHVIPSFEKEKLTLFVGKVLEFIKNSFDKKLVQFTGIPLQTRMIAEVFTEEIQHFHESGNMILNRNVNGVRLFEEFVRIKRTVQMEKIKVPRWEQKRLEEQGDRDLMKLALLTLLSRSECASLRPPISDEEVQQLRELVNKGGEKSGIVISFKGETPQFTHRTFAEYFVALFLAKNYQNNRAFMNSDTFFSPSFEFVKYFFDNMLATGHDLHEAILRRAWDEFRTMLQGRVDINAIDAGGRTVLHIVAGIPDSESEITNLLLCKARVDIVDVVIGGRPIEYASKVRCVRNIAPLLECDPDAKVELNIPITWESLLVAVRGDYLELAKYLMENGIAQVEPLNALTPQKWITHGVSENLTVLHLIAHYNAKKILQYSLPLLTEMLEIKSQEGLTPVLQAAKAGHLSLARELVEAGADPLQTTSDGKNLSVFAVEEHNIPLLMACLREIKENPGEHLSLALTALIGDKSKEAAWLLELMYCQFPSLISVRIAKTLSQLAAACMKRNEFIVSKLLDLGADVNEMTPIGTPLQCAIIRRQEKIVESLLKSRNIDVNLADKEGCTPLFKAVLKGSVPIFKMLIDAGANLNVCTVNGDNLGHAFAKSVGSETIFSILQSKGVDFYKPNNAGVTALDLLKTPRGHVFAQKIDPDYNVLKANAPKELPKKNEENSSPLLKEKNCGEGKCDLDEAFKKLGIAKNRPIHSSSPVPSPTIGDGKPIKPTLGKGMGDIKILQQDNSPQLIANNRPIHSSSHVPLATVGEDKIIKPTLGKGMGDIKILQQDNAPQLTDIPRKMTSEITIHPLEDKLPPQVNSPLGFNNHPPSLSHLPTILPPSKPRGGGRKNRGNMHNVTQSPQPPQNQPGRRGGKGNKTGVDSQRGRGNQSNHAYNEKTGRGGSQHQNLDRGSQGGGGEAGSRYQNAFRDGGPQRGRGGTPQVRNQPQQRGKNQKNGVGRGNSQPNQSFQNNPGGTSKQDQKPRGEDSKRSQSGGPEKRQNGSGYQKTQAKNPSQQAAHYFLNYPQDGMAPMEGGNIQPQARHDSQSLYFTLERIGRDIMDSMEERMERDIMDSMEGRNVQQQVRKNSKHNDKNPSCIIQ